MVNSKLLERKQSALAKAAAFSLNADPTYFSLQDYKYLGNG